jgi:general secretion pathway protein N
MLLVVSTVGSSAVTSPSADFSISDESNKTRAPRGLDASTIWADSPSTPVQVVTAPAPREAAPPPVLSDNPLWAVPIATLSATRDRPIFSSSRRPPVSAVAPAVQRVAPPPKPKEPDRPQLSLVGTIASAEQGFGIFLDAVSRTALRLRVGEEYQGWKLRSVRSREVILEKDETAATLTMTKTGEERVGGIEPENGSKRSALQSVGRRDR